MTRDAILVGALVLTMALLLTAHVTIAFGLLFRRPRWRALVALIAVPLAPILAWRAAMRARAVLWTVSLVAYGAALAIGWR